MLANSGHANVFEEQTTRKTNFVHPEHCPDMMFWGKKYLPGVPSVLVSVFIGDALGEDGLERIGEGFNLALKLLDVNRSRSFVRLGKSLAQQIDQDSNVRGGDKVVKLRNPVDTEALLCVVVQAEVDTSSDPGGFRRLV